MIDHEKSIEMTSLESDVPGLKYGWPIEKYNKWMEDLNKRREGHPFEERRIGWISKLPNYRVCCCGQSISDLFLILLFFVLFYAANGLVLWGIWSLTSLDLVITSYIYGLIGFVFIVILLWLITLKGKSLDNSYLESLAESNSAVCLKKHKQET